MSRIADKLIEAYEMLLRTREAGAQRELHSFIRRRFSGRETINKLKQARLNNRPGTTTKKHKEIVLDYTKTQPVAREEVSLGTPVKETEDDLTIDQLVSLIDEGEDALLGEFGSVDAFREYTLNKFEGLDYGRKTVFNSVTQAFLDYVGEPEEEEIDFFA